jgi:hypothetical protein
MIEAAPVSFHPPAIAMTAVLYNRMPVGNDKDKRPDGLGDQ